MRCGYHGGLPFLALHMHRHPRTALWLASSLLAAATATTPARAQDADSIADSRDDDGKPIWSLGLGVVAMRLPDYRGADESRNRVLPFPAFFYRGPRVQATREGIRAELFEGSRFCQALGSSPACATASMS